jgi:hypothetical protein
MSAVVHRNIRRIKIQMIPLDCALVSAAVLVSVSSVLVFAEAVVAVVAAAAVVAVVLVAEAAVVITAAVVAEVVAVVVAADMAAELVANRNKIPLKFLKKACPVCISAGLFSLDRHN